MTKRPTPEPSAGKSRRKRATPTIDLKATEVRAEPVASDTPSEKPPVQEPPAEQPPRQEPPVKEPPAQDPPVKEPPKPKPQPAESQGTESNAAPPPSNGANSGAKSGGNFGIAMAAGVIGALVMSLVAAGLWFAGIVTLRDGGSDTANTRVTALETQIQELQNRPAPPVAAASVPDTKAVDALGARVADMETAIKAIPPADTGLADRASAADNAMKSLGVALTALNRRNDELADKTGQAQQRAAAAEKAVSDLRAGLQDVSKTASAGASSAELEPLQQRIAALEQSVQSARGDVEKAAASGKAARLALSATALRDAVLRGAPFAGELAQAKALGADDKSIAPLTSFAASGVPDAKTLAQELRTLLPALQKAAGAQTPAGGFLERLQANAGQLVRVRPLDAPPGTDASAVLARIEYDAAHDDIAAALADIGKLPEAGRQLAADWVTRAISRQQALAAARQLAADTARALGPG